MLPGDSGHRNVEPGPVQGLDALIDIVDDFPPDNVRMAQIGAYPSSPLHGTGHFEFKGFNVSPKSQQMLLRRR